MKMPSNRNHRFSEVPQAEIPRSSFSRPHGYKTTFNAGELIPVFMDEALPGDTFTLRMAAFARLATPLHPFMDNMYMNSFFFAVPIRLIWDNWQKFNGEQANPGDSTDYIVPEITAPPEGYVNGSLHDYLGLPTEVGGIKHSALWHRANNLIWNEWFRDQNLQQAVEVPKDDGPDQPELYQVMRRGKRHDYFTSCLPWPQKGESVDIPLGQSAPVYGVGWSDTFPPTGFPSQQLRETGGVLSAASSVNDPTTLPGVALRVDPANAGYPLVEADLTNATAATINQLRQAFQIQKLYERDARGGTRYTEIIRAHFGVTSPDERLQRPEYLGGGQSPVTVRPVPQTSSTDATSPQGNLAAEGTVTVDGHGFTKSFTEHCVLLGFVCVRADLNYQQGLHRMYSRSTRWDFYWPALAHIGEQAVLNKEIYADGSPDDEAVFGYQERFAEYRYKQSMITGQFRSNFAQSLDTWHLAQDFGVTRPLLSETFIEENPPVERVIAVPTYPHFIFDGFFTLQCARPMPIFGVPGLIDHF